MGRRQGRNHQMLSNARLKCCRRLRIVKHLADDRAGMVLMHPADAARGLWIGVFVRPIVAQRPGITSELGRRHPHLLARAIAS